MPPSTRLLILAFVLASMYCVGALQDGSRFAVAAERARLLVVIALAWLGFLGLDELAGLQSTLMLPRNSPAIAWSVTLGCSGFAVASLLWLKHWKPGRGHHK